MLYAHPKHERTRYYNEILPQMYKGAFTELGERFQDYFFKERSERYDFKIWQDGLNRKMSFLLHEPNHSGLNKYLSDNMKNYKSGSVSHCSSGLSQLQGLSSTIDEKLEHFKIKRGDLYVYNTLKSGKLEQDNYFKECIEYLITKKSECNTATERLINVIGKIKQATAGMTSFVKPYEKNRRKRENKKKAEKRKQHRFTARASYVVELISTCKGDEVLRKKEKVSSINVNALDKLKPRFDKKSLEYLIGMGAFGDSIVPILRKHMDKWKEAATISVLDASGSTTSTSEDSDG
jgi:hypothetical protein